MSGPTRPVDLRTNKSGGHAEMDNLLLLLGVVGLGVVIIGSAVWLSGQRPDAKVRQSIARADRHLAVQEFDASRQLLASAEEPFSLVSDEAQRRELRSEIDRRLGSIALIADDYDEAERRLTSAVENCDTLLSARDPSSIGPLGNLALVQFEQGNDLNADAAFERLLAYEPNEYPLELALTAELLRELAMACVVRDFYRWPERLLLRSIEQYDDRCDPDGDRRMRAWLNLAQARVVVADYRGTREALEAASALAGDEDADSMFAYLRGQLALLACEWEDAGELLSRNHEMACNALGERSNAAADALGALADLRRVQGRFAEARDLSRETVDIIEECLGGDAPTIAWHLARHGMICIQHGDLSEAGRHLDRSIGLARQRKRRANSLLGALHMIRGVLELERERLDAAAAALLESRRISESVYGRGHRLTMESIMILGEVRLEQGNLAEAAQLAGEALDIGQRHDEMSPLDRIDLHNMLARVRLAQDDLDAAEQSLADANRLVERHLTIRHYAFGEVLHERGRLRRRQGRFEEADRDYCESLRIQENVRLEQHPVIARLLDDHAELVAELGRESEAAGMRARAASIRAALA